MTNKEIFDFFQSEKKRQGVKWEEVEKRTSVPASIFSKIMMNLKNNKNVKIESIFKIAEALNLELKFQLKK